VHALNAIAPEYGLADRLKWYVLPSDSLKVIQDTPNLVSRISFRASARTQFLQRLNFLSHEEKRNLRNRLQDFEAEAALKSPDREARLLDAGADYFDFRFASDLQNENSRAAKLKKFWLQKRAEILSPSPALESKIWLKVTPDQGHGSLRASFSGGRDSHGESYLEVGFRGAFHDLLDRLEGYPESAEIEFFNFSFRNYWAQQKFRLTDATLFKAFSISPISQFEVSPSWRMHVFASSSQSRSCDFCISGTGETAGGFTLNLGSATLPVLWYSLASVQIEGSPRFRKHSVILSAGPETGLRFSWSQRHLSLLTAVSRYKVFFQEWEQFYSARHRSSISDSLAVEARVSESERSIDYGLGFFFYF